MLINYSKYLYTPAAIAQCPITMADIVKNNIYYL